MNHKILPISEFNHHDVAIYIDLIIVNSSVNLGRPSYTHTCSHSSDATLVLLSPSPGPRCSCASRLGPSRNNTDHPPAALRARRSSWSRSQQQTFGPPTAVRSRRCLSRRLVRRRPPAAALRSCRLACRRPPASALWSCGLSRCHCLHAVAQRAGRGCRPGSGMNILHKCEQGVPKPRHSLHSAFRLACMWMITPMFQLLTPKTVYRVRICRPRRRV